MEETTGSERDVLLRFLNKMRDAVVRVADGLGEEELRRPGVASGTNLLGLIRHLTAYEVYWFRRVFLGEELEIDDSMLVPATESREDVVAAYREACARSDVIVRSCPDLSTLAAAPNRLDTRDSLRVIVVHMIEETARHAGHADIIREQLDGVTGR